MEKMRERYLQEVLALARARKDKAAQLRHHRQFTEQRAQLVLQRHRSMVRNCCLATGSFGAFFISKLIFLQTVPSLLTVLVAFANVDELLEKRSGPLQW
jgi:hypothetical protein